MDNVIYTFMCIFACIGGKTLRKIGKKYDKNCPDIKRGQLKGGKLRMCRDRYLIAWLVFFVGLAYFFTGDCGRIITFDLYTKIWWRRWHHRFVSSSLAYFCLFVVKDGSVLDV